VMIPMPVRRTISPSVNEDFTGELRASDKRVDKMAYSASLKMRI
jgi:hypothetical protein